MKTQRSSFLSLTALLALSLGLVNSLSAQTSVASTTGMPIITSYAPASAPVGESVLANLGVDSTTFGGAVFGEVLQVSRVQFRTSLGMSASVPVTYVAPRLIRFTIPDGAISGTPTLVCDSPARSRVQPNFQVVSFASRARGFTIINSAQWTVGSVKTGTTELLTGATLPPGTARFFSRSLTANKPLPLSITYKSDIGPVTSGEDLFTVAEQVLIRGTSSGLTLLTRTELTLEPFTVAEILRMGAANTANASWKVIQRNLRRTLEVAPNGDVTLSEVSPRGLPVAPIQLKIDEIGAEFSGSRIRFSLKDSSNRRSGEVITLYAPFNVFAATKLGPWDMEDELPAAVSPNVGPPPSADDLQPSPMLVRRRL